MSGGGALLITVMMPGHRDRAGMGTAMGHGHYRCQEVLHRAPGIHTSGPGSVLVSQLNRHSKSVHLTSISEKER